MGASQSQRAQVSPFVGEICRSDAESWEECTHQEEIMNNAYSMNHRDYVGPPSGRLRVMRNGSSIIRSAGVPKPEVIVDSREQNPFQFLPDHSNWIGSERRFTLKTGDYSIDGMEELLALERKSLADIVACTVNYRKRFIASCSRLARFKWKAILIEATLEDIKSGFEQFDIISDVHPNAVTGTLDAIEAKFGIPIIYTSMIRSLATERAASWLSKHFTYWWLETHRLGRVLIDHDKL